MNRFGVGRIGIDGLRPATGPHTDSVDYEGPRPNAMRKTSMSAPPSLSDAKKFTTIAHAGHRYYSPISAARAAALIALLPLQHGDPVLDVGCGRAQFLLELLQACPALGIGIDDNETFVAVAQAQAKVMGVADRLSLIARPLKDAATEDGTLAAVISMGSSQAIGSLADAMAWAFRTLRRGGVALFADGYWKQPPTDAYLKILGATAGEMRNHAGNAALARDAGFRVLHTMTSNDDEWDEYEGLYCGAIERYVDTHPDDPDVPAMAQRIRAWHDAYLAWGRATLGFGFYLLLKPMRD
jgi:SAM-dependent methyltransferase